MKALVIGGTGPTGPYLVNGLIEQGYDVSILHRGTHDNAGCSDDNAMLHGQAATYRTAPWLFDVHDQRLFRKRRAR